MPGLLTIMGSGETSPTMVSVHRSIAERLRPAASAVVIETPYGFQENVADISARARQYFARSVGLRVDIAPGLRGLDSAVSGDRARGLAMVRTADWLFSGPGNPSYALRWWQETAIDRAMHDRLRRRGGVTVLASAAAATMGRWAVPVYEIYKVGAAPHWLDGLDLLGHLGLRVAVIPHYDNTEGGTHDTRFCYLGERRLALMERELADDAAVLGVDEHTATIFDLGTDTVRVVGRGALTVRHHGHSTVIPTGATLTLTDLRALCHGDTATAVLPPGPAAEAMNPPTVTEIAADCERRFNDAHLRRDADGMAHAVLDLEAAIHDWSTDTELDDGAEQARAVLRTLVVRLAHTGLTDPAHLLAPMVEPLLELRGQLRARQEFDTADALRKALTAGGVDLHDEAHGTRWVLRHRNLPAPPVADNGARPDTNISS